MQLHAPPVAIRAKEVGLPLAQPAKIRELQHVDADLGVVIAYGKILPASLLAIPKHGFINVHASLLPKYRGAAPIQRAIENGETTTGVTIMRVDEELDHGPMLDIATQATACARRGDAAASAHELARRDAAGSRAGD